MPLPADAAAAAARFLVLKGLPLLVVDLEPPPGDDEEVPALLREGLFRTLVERGLAVLPRFYGVDLPRGVRVGLTVDEDRLRLEDDDETTLLRVPRASVDEEWLRHGLRLQGSMLCVGRAIGVDPDQTPHEVCDLLDLAATDDRVAGAIVGVAQPQVGLPIFG